MLFIFDHYSAYFSRAEDDRWHLRKGFRRENKTSHLVQSSRNIFFICWLDKTLWNILSKHCTENLIIYLDLVSLTCDSCKPTTHQLSSMFSITVEYCDHQDIKNCQSQQRNWVNQTYLHTSYCSVECSVLIGTTAVDQSSTKLNIVKPWCCGEIITFYFPQFTGV